MAKLGFKDIIMKYLKKDESTPMGGKFIVRFKRGDQKPVQAIFDTKAQADAYEKEKRRMGFEIVEDLNQDDEKVINVHGWHTRRVSERDEDCEDNLRISYLKDKFWSCVDLFIVILNDASCFLRIE